MQKAGRFRLSTMSLEQRMFVLFVLKDIASSRDSASITNIENTPGKRQEFQAQSRLKKSKLQAKKTDQQSAMLVADCNNRVR